MPGKIAFRDVHHLCRDDFSFQVARFPDRRVFRHSQDPAHAREPLLGVNQLRQFIDFRARFHHPIVAGDPGIQGAGLDVARHLLRAHQQTLDFGVVNRRNITSRAQRDLPAGTRKKIECRVLQAPFRDSQFQPAHRDFSFPYTVSGAKVRSAIIFVLPSGSIERKKQLR